MVAKIKLVISETNKTIDTVVMETSTTPASLMKSLEEFKIAANASLTKLIENSGYSGNMDFEDDASEDEAEDDMIISPKKKKT